MAAAGERTRPDEAVYTLTQQPVLTCDELVRETASLIDHLIMHAVRADPQLRPGGLDRHVGRWLRYAVNELTSVCEVLAVPVSG